MLEIAATQHDYRVAFSKENFKLSQLWAFVEEVNKGILVPPLDLVLPLLHLQYPIHVVFGGSDLQSLTIGELLLVKEIMSGKFGIPSAKEAKALLEGTASLSQNKKGKRKRLPDTRVMDDPKAYKLSKVEAASTPTATQARIPMASTSVESSPSKSTKREWSKSSESEGTLTITLLANGSAYSDPSFMKYVTESLLLPTGCKRLNDIRPIQSAE